MFVALVGLLTISQAVGWAGTTTIAIFQSLTPYLGVALLPLIALAFWRRHLVLVTVASSVAAALLVLAAPLAFPDPQPPVAADSSGLRIASLNLWYENTRVDEIDEALAEVDADVIVFNEYTPPHRDTLQATPLADTYAERLDRPGLGATGIAIWSRWPLRIDEPIDTFNDSLDVTVSGPDGDIRIVAMHMPTPIVNFDAWRSDLETAADIGSNTTGPTLLIGDLNSSYWHPDFRRLLDVGFTDANAAMGSGFSTSWPTDKKIPPFVRLDHALTIGGLVSTGVVDFDVPGSDHLGLVVTVAPVR
jgi:endonuclease/exonuclease/phosphatase (EEP) superfamily protein YafD